MRYVAAYLLAVLGGKAAPSQNDIEKILSSVGIETDAEKLKKVIAELAGKSIDDLIAQGKNDNCQKKNALLRYAHSYNKIYIYSFFHNYRT